jgi:hypothetical protein
MVRKILIVGFYELKDHMICIRECFEDLNYIVTDYPLFQYAYDSNDRVDDYNEHMDDYIKKANPDIILWYFADVKPQLFKYIKKSNNHIIQLLFNFDDPINFNSNLINICKNMDIVVTSCEENIYKYTHLAGVEYVKFIPFGFDEEYFHKIDLFDESLKSIDQQSIESIDSEKNIKKFTCDISMIVYNMYDIMYYGDQYINRKDLLDIISNYCNTKNYKFNLYGTPSLNELYPDHYVGEISYLDQNKLFNYSKINIVTHADSTKKLQITDLEMKIMGSGGLLVMDPVHQSHNIIFKHNENCYILDKNKIVDDFDNILQNYDAYDVIKENGINTALQYNWKNWTKNVHILINKANFNQELYKELYDIDEDIGFDHWLANGSNRICYNVSVPVSFDHVSYKEVVELDPDKYRSRDKIYIHWLENSRDNVYMKKQNSNNTTMDIGKIGTVEDQIIECWSLFTKIRSIQDQHIKNTHIDMLGSVVHNSPSMDINSVLKLYFNMVDN